MQTTHLVSKLFAAMAQPIVEVAQRLVLRILNYTTTHHRLLSPTIIPIVARDHQHLLSEMVIRTIIKDASTVLGPPLLLGSFMTWIRLQVLILLPAAQHIAEVVAIWQLLMQHIRTWHSIGEDTVAVATLRINVRNYYLQLTANLHVPPTLHRTVVDHSRQMDIEALYRSMHSPEPLLRSQRIRETFKWPNWWLMKSFWWWPSGIQLIFMDIEVVRSWKRIDWWECLRVERWSELDLFVRVGRFLRCRVWSIEFLWGWMNGRICFMLLTSLLRMNSDPWLWVLQRIDIAWLQPSKFICLLLRHGYHRTSLSLST